MKIIKILFVNLLLIFVFLISVESYYVNKWRGWEHIYDNPKDIIKNMIINKNFCINNELYKKVIIDSISVDNYFNMLYKRDIVPYAFTGEFRPDENINSDKKPVVFIGCSFTWGESLNQNQTVSAQFAKYTNRPTYNRGGNGWGLSYFLYQTRRDDFYLQFKEEPEYLFYIYIADHNNRLDRFKIEPTTLDFQPKYIKKNNHLVEQKPKFYDRLFFVLDYQHFYNFRNNKVDAELVKLYFTEARDAIRKHWKNTKLVLLVYPTENYQIEYEVCNKMVDEGYIVINIGDLVTDIADNKYKCFDGWHPSLEAWQIILPKVIKELNIT